MYINYCKYNKKTKATIYVCFYFLVKQEFYIMENDNHDKALVKLGITIRKLREDTTPYSQEKFGLEVDLSENQIRRIEKGQTNPTIKSLLKIAKVLKVNIKDLFEE